MEIYLMIIQRENLLKWRKRGKNARLKEIKISSEWVEKFKCVAELEETLRGKGWASMPWNLIIVFISVTESFNERRKNYECFHFVEEL